MMGADPSSGTLLQDTPVPMPSPLRTLLYALLTVIMIFAVYICVQTAMMIYDFYQILQWLGGLTA